MGGHLKVGTGIFNLSESELQRLQLSYTERQLVRPFYTTQQLGRYWGDTQNELWIIYTDSVSAQPRAMEAYPRLREHLDQFAPILTSAYKPYGLHRARDADLFLGEKILSLRKAAQPTFTFVDFPCYVSQSFNIIKTERMNLKYLTAVLNSTLLRFWFKNRAKMQGHQYQVDSAPLTMAPIADAVTSLQLRLAALVDLILTASAKLSVAVTDPQRNAMQRVIDDAERQIQGHIYKIYGLSAAEVAEVEDALSDADV